MPGDLSVELVGDVIVARVRGEPTESLLQRCQDQVLQLVRDTGRERVLYDTLEMDPPPVDVPLAQWKLDEALTSYREALRFKPDYPDAHINAATILQAQGHFEEALACYEQALHHQPDHPDAHLCRALTWLLAFFVWWSFIVGHVLNNIRGLLP